MIVLVHRESANEDGTPPPKAVHVPDGATLLDLLHIVRRLDYLPAIDGGRATWLCEGEMPLAIVTQEYREPWTLVRGERRLEGLAGKLPQPHFLFRYLGKESPEEAFRRYGGDPVRLPKEAWDPSAEITWPDALRRLLSPRTRGR